MRLDNLILTPGLIFFLVLTWATTVCGGAYKYHFPKSGEGPASGTTVVGYFRTHTISPKETLLDAARNYGLGFNDLELLYPHIDPWIPNPGTHLCMPTQWILPPSRHNGIVINIPELRLYRFFPKIGMVKTYPIGIGDIDWKTPRGNYRVIARKENPTWVIPTSLREKYETTQIPPGPENPLGKYWLGLSLKGYGIHGTNSPWGVGRLISHGCIRLYPEHIAQLFGEVPLGTPVEIVYEPIKFGVREGEIFIEVHPDPYDIIPDLTDFALNRLNASGLEPFIAMESVYRALKHPTGVPVRIGNISKGGDISITGDAATQNGCIIPTNQHVKRRSKHENG